MNINLEEKLEILHEFAYNNEDTELTEKIHGNISLGDIKFSNKSEYIDELKKQSFKNISLINILPFSNTIVLGSKNLPLTLFINPYENRKDTKDKKNPFNLDSALSYLLSPLVINKITPNLLLPLINFDIKLNDLPIPILALPAFTSLKKKIKKDKYSDILSVRVRENYSNMKSLHTYLKNASSKRKIELRPIIFQALYTLAKLEKNYKGFRHNQLDCHSIFISRINNVKKYSHNSVNYYLGFKNNFIKIGNFTASYVPKMFKSKLVEDKKFKYMKNSGFDVHYFLNSLIYRDVNLNNVSDKKEVLDFIDRIIPKKNRGNTKNKYYMNSSVKLPSLDKILKDDYFKEYTIIPKEKIDVSMSIKQEKKLKQMIGLQSSEQSPINQSNSESNDSNATTEDDMVGGYVEHNKRPIKNNPNISNDKRQTFKRRMEEKPRKPREPTVLVEQKIYNPLPPPKPVRPPPVLPFVPIGNTGGPLVNYPYPYNNVVNKVPIQKIYNITIGDPSVTGNYIGEFFEDMIPSSPYPLNSLSLTDRIKLRGFVRNLLIEKMDGEEGSIVGGEKSLRKHFKWGPFNPYSLAKSPYNDIASNFCLYSVFYPFRYDHEKKVFNVAKDATSFNIRTYNLSVGSLYHDKLTEEMKLNNFNVFRELTYYKYILSEVINKKVSPNFVNMIMYKVDKETKIKYDKLIDVKLRHLPQALRDLAYKPLDILSTYDEQVKNAKQFLTKMDAYLRNNNQSMDIAGDLKRRKMMNELNKSGNIDGLDAETDHYVLQKYIADIFDDPEQSVEAEKILHLAGLSKDDIDLDYNSLGLDTVSIQTRRQIRKRKLQELTKMLFIFGISEKSLKLTEQSNRSLVVMTEGPTHNILRWTCPIYNQNGAQHTMIGTGYHSEEAWNSVYFQIIHSLLVLVKHGILFKELSLDKNVFIKDIFHSASNIGHWKYNVDNHSFYVPNHGYVVMFDSSYSDEIDIMNMNNTLDRATISNFNKTRHYKINSENLFELSNSKEFINSTTFNNNKFAEVFKKSITTMLSNETLRQRIEEMQGIMPVKNIFDKLNKISNDINKSANSLGELEKTLNEILVKHFSNYLHSRLGTSLSKNEMNNVSLLPIRNFKQGSLVIYQERYGEYKWAIYVGKQDAYKHLIIKDNKGATVDVFLASLRSYPENMTIDHSFKQGYKYEEDDLLDTYTI